MAANTTSTVENMTSLPISSAPNNLGFEIRELTHSLADATFDRLARLMRKYPSAFWDLVCMVRNPEHFIVNCQLELLDKEGVWIIGGNIYPALMVDAINQFVTGDEWNQLVLHKPR